MIKTKRLLQFDRDWYYKPEKDAPIYWVSRKTMTDDQVDEFFMYGIMWCENTFGKLTRHPAPQVEWCWNDRQYQELNLSGEYDREDNTIYIRMQSHRTIYNVANTLVHEYIHYLQSPYGGWYKRYHNHYGYLDNPYEKEAFYIGDLYGVECARTVLEWMYPNA